MYHENVHSDLDFWDRLSRTDDEELTARLRELELRRRAIEAEMAAIVGVGSSENCTPSTGTGR